MLLFSIGIWTAKRARLTGRDSQAESDQQPEQSVESTDCGARVAQGRVQPEYRAESASVRIVPHPDGVRCHPGRLRTVTLNH